MLISKNIFSIEEFYKITDKVYVNLLIFLSI